MLCLCCIGVLSSAMQDPTRVRKRRSKAGDSLLSVSFSLSLSLSLSFSFVLVFCFLVLRLQEVVNCYLCAPEVYPRHGGLSARSFLARAHMPLAST